MTKKLLFCLLSTAFFAVAADAGRKPYRGVATSAEFADRSYVSRAQQFAVTVMPVYSAPGLAYATWFTSFSSTVWPMSFTHAGVAYDQRCVSGINGRAFEINDRTVSTLIVSISTSEAYVGMTSVDSHEAGDIVCDSIASENRTTAKHETNDSVSDMRKYGNCIVVDDSVVSKSLTLAVSERDASMSGKARDNAGYTVDDSMSDGTSYCDTTVPDSNVYVAARGSAAVTVRNDFVHNAATCAQPADFKCEYDTQSYFGQLMMMYDATQDPVERSIIANQVESLLKRQRQGSIFN